ncbi:MAG: STAS domain-containing protein [bacterium]|nr:STAS domain-containing protein [bacterium]
MQYIAEREDGILIIQLQESVLNQQMTDDLRKVLFGGLRDNHRATILDFGDVTYAASLPLSILFAIGEQLRDYGRRLLLVGVPEIVRQALQFQYSTQPFEYCSDRLEALQALQTV